ncbi:beta-lactamase AmpC [Rickettsia rhipicephali str. 3-7-female6-CWPP]|uniref:Beta-lactamase AmpC n=1 Tax=Rickettsia rhipicephali (strain 3-7-female6-CWPP) TaxID=1105113 RepID=A0AAI8A8R8_RICR3|nr:hypothetical protein [Rickettsia rhipicephali]AFC71767.1 beta-lactamase AmpC [Rickettsia rhipicephali str. 3-7-female6-CWPP]
MLYKYSNIVFSLLEEALNCKKSSLNAAIDNLRTTLKTQDIQILPLYKIVKSNKDVFGFKWQPIWSIDQKMIESYYALGWRILKVKGRSRI